MKKRIKYLVILFLLSVNITNVNAVKLGQSEYEEYGMKRAYVIGNYVFDLSKHNPTLGDLMIANQTNPVGQASIIEIKIATNIDGEITREYRELLTGTKLDEFPDIDVNYIYRSQINYDNPELEDKIVLEEAGAGGEQITDTSIPICSWDELVENLEVGNTSSISLSCTDESGIKTTQLTSSAFEVTSNFTILTIQSEPITNGYKYNITIEGISSGVGKIILKSGQILDNNNNKNVRLESGEFTISMLLTVTFDSNGGTNIASQSINYNAKATKPTNPTREGYIFKEWQLNGTTYDFNKEVIENITLKAVWTKILYGDVNTDGEVDGRDILRLTTYISSGDGLTEQGLKNADVNADGKVDKTDEVLLSQFVGGSYTGTLPNSPITE